MNPALLFLASLLLMLVFGLGVWVGEDEGPDAFWPHGAGWLLLIGCGLGCGVSVVRMLAHFLS